MASNLLNPRSVTNNLLDNNMRRYEMIAARVEGVSSKTMFMMLFLIIKKSLFDHCRRRKEREEISATGAIEVWGLSPREPPPE